MAIEYVGDDADFIDTRETSQEIGEQIVKPQTLAKWRCEGRSPLPYYKIAGKVFYRRGDARAFRERSRIEANVPAEV